MRLTRALIARLPPYSRSKIQIPKPSALLRTSFLRPSRRLFFKKLTVSKISPSKGKVIESATFVRALSSIKSNSGSEGLSSGDHGVEHEAEPTKRTLKPDKVRFYLPAKLPAFLNDQRPAKVEGEIDDSDFQKPLEVAAKVFPFLEPGVEVLTISGSRPHWPHTDPEEVSKIATVSLWALGKNGRYMTVHLRKDGTCTPQVGRSTLPLSIPLPVWQDTLEEKMTQTEKDLDFEKRKHLEAKLKAENKRERPERDAYRNDMAAKKVIRETEKQKKASKTQQIEAIASHMKNDQDVQGNSGKGRA